MTVDTRRYLLEGRNGLIYLPAHGKHGGTLAKIADSCGVSRQFVHLTLFPDTVEGMFGSSITSKMVWTQCAKLVFDHPLYETMKLAFTRLESEKIIVMRVPVNIITFFMKRASQIGLDCIITDSEPTSPITYEIALSKQ